MLKTFGTPLVNPITPAHLALGRSLSSLPDVCNKEMSIQVRYKYLQQLQDHFWKRWSKEYLPQLQLRQKWKTTMPSVNVNDVCLIAEDKMTRSKWPLARVVDVIKGRDGIVRTARLKTKHGVCSRPIQKILLFEKFVPTD